MKRYNEGDVFSALRRPPNSVTGAATAQVDSLNICSGTTYTLSLPTASAHKGKMIGWLVSATGLVTIGTKITWAGESGLLFSDGSSWLSLFYCPVPMSVKIVTIADTATLTGPPGAWGPVPITTVQSGFSSMFDSTNKRITIVRPGQYSCVAFAYIQATSSTFGYVACSKNSTTGATDGLGSSSATAVNPASHPVLHQCVAGDYLSCNFYGNGSGWYAPIAGGGAAMSATEIPVW